MEGRERGKSGLNGSREEKRKKKIETKEICSSKHNPVVSANNVARLGFFPNGFTVDLRSKGFQGTPRFFPI